MEKQERRKRPRAKLGPIKKPSGATLQEMTFKSAKEIGINWSEANATMVASVDEGEQADRKGVREGWRVVGVHKYGCTPTNVNKILNAVKIKRKKWNMTFQTNMTAYRCVAQDGILARTDNNYEATVYQHDDCNMKLPYGDVVGCQLLKDGWIYTAMGYWLPQKDQDGSVVLTQTGSASPGTAADV